MKIDTKDDGDNIVGQYQDFLRYIDNDIKNNLLPGGDEKLDKMSNFENLLEENHFYRKMLPTDDDGGDK